MLFEAVQCMLYLQKLYIKLNGTNFYGLKKFMHVEDDHESGARAVAGKSRVTADQSKKRAGSSRANESPEYLTGKRHRTM
jgi:hypothetical protein